MEKSPQAFRTISEVADWLDTPAHVLRFWESRFPEIAPVKRAGGRRYYRPQDMQLLGGIKHLLHTEGHTIKSVQERLKAGGTGAICAYSPPLATGPSQGEAEAEDDAALVDATAEAVSADDFTADEDEIREAAANGHHPADSGAGDWPAETWPTETRIAEEMEMDAQDAVPEDLGDPGFEAADETLPPIGFFFDDSDDAAPAEDQSGTFAATAPEPDPFAHGFVDPAPEEAPEPEPEAPDDLVAEGLSEDLQALPDLPDLPEDAADHAPVGAPVVAAAAELRGLTRRDLPFGWRERLPEIIRRLDRLCRDDR
jgi:DNA-binding transcriptional MerR regulator